MTNKIKSVDNRNKSIITSRNAVPNAYTRTININQADGNFVTTFPIENKVVVYGQSPNSANSFVGNSRTIEDLDAYGTFDFPIDAKFDFVNRKIWVADTGNNRLLSINYNSFLVDFEITNVIFPSAIVVNPNNGDIFVRGYSNITTGCIYWMDTHGKTIDTLLFDDIFPYGTFEIAKDIQTGHDLPSPASIKFDHVRSRLWWTTETKIYMADVITKTVSSYDLSSDFQFIGAIGLDLNSGNAFVGASNEIGETEKFSNIVCVYKDNNLILQKMKVAFSVKSAELSLLALPDIEPGQSSAWPDEFIFSDFDNTAMNGLWERHGNYRGQLYSYVCPNNTLVFSDAVPSGQYGIGSYIMQPSGKYEWEFIFYKIENYPVISQKWIYRQETKSDRPTGKYVLSSYYSVNPLVVNPYPSDSGYIDTDAFSDSSLSSISSALSESSSSGLETESYEQQITRTILVDQSGHHNLLPFAYAVDSSPFKNNSNELPFTFSNATSLDYSSMFKTNGISSSWLQSASNTYVPQPDYTKYTHENEVFIDVITSNVIAVSSSKVSAMQNGLHEMVPTEKFTIPKFTWKIRAISQSHTNPVVIAAPDVTPDVTTAQTQYFRLSDDFARFAESFGGETPPTCIKTFSATSVKSARSTVYSENPSYITKITSVQSSSIRTEDRQMENIPLAIILGGYGTSTISDNYAYYFRQNPPQKTNDDLSNIVGEYFLYSYGGVGTSVTNEMRNRIQSNNWKFYVTEITKEEYNSCGSSVSVPSTETRECDPYIQLSTGFYDAGFGLPYVLKSRRPDTCLAVGSYQYERQTDTGGVFQKIFVYEYIDTSGIHRTRVDITSQDPSVVVAGRTYLRATYLNKQSYLSNETPIILGDYELAWTTPQELGDILAQNTLPIAIYASTKEQYEATGGT